MRSGWKTGFEYLTIAAISALYALVYELFVFPNNFAPAGINGIATMIQYVFQINVGYLSMVINLPLAVFVFCRVDRKLAVRSGLYILVFSLCLIAYDHLPLDRFRYSTDTSAILGPVAAGIFAGWAYSMFLRRGGTTGGMDFIAAILHKRNPEKSLMQTVFLLNTTVAVISYFVYGFQVEPVLLCVIYCFLTSTVSDRLLQGSRKALKVEVITDSPDEMATQIIEKLGHSATAVPAKGMYKGAAYTILYVVVNPRQRPELEQILRLFPGSFATISEVSAVMGRFHKVRKDGTKEMVSREH